MNLSRETMILGTSIRFIIPNLVIVCRFCLGLTAIRFTLEKEWKLAVIAILVAGFIDFLDGFAAWVLTGGSQFGAELDSLSDFVCFGVAPAILLYRWTLNEAGWVGWSVALLFCVCSALRLARLNSQASKNTNTRLKSHFFSGIPVPAGAVLACTPMFMSFQFGSPLPFSSWFAGFLLLLVSLLMINTFPTFSLKTIPIEKFHILGGTSLFLGIAIFLTLFPWVTVTYAGLVSVLSIPISVKKYKQIGSESWR